MGPNILTAARIALLAPLFILIVFPAQLGVEATTSRWLALACYLAAGLTDIADGYLARRLNQATAFGAMFDKIADRLLTLVAVVALVAAGHIAGIFTLAGVALVARDLLVVSFHEALPGRIGRLKAVENIKIALCYGGLALIIAPAPVPPQAGLAAITIGGALIAVTVALYGAQALRALREGEKV